MSDENNPLRKAEEESIRYCFDQSEPLAMRLREAADISDDIPAWLDQFLYQAAREVEAMVGKQENQGENKQNEDER
jgi:hypothetical protein